MLQSLWPGVANCVSPVPKPCCASEVCPYCLSCKEQLVDAVKTERPHLTG